MSFEEHIKSEHNMWHYLYFLVLLRVKAPTEYTGPESYVAQMIMVSRANTHINTVFLQNIAAVKHPDTVLARHPTSKTILKLLLTNTNPVSEI